MCPTHFLGVCRWPEEATLLLQLAHFLGRRLLHFLSYLQKVFGNQTEIYSLIKNQVCSIVREKGSLKL